jgi:hypothetical protein
VYYLTLARALPTDYENSEGFFENFSAKLKFQGEFTEGIPDGLIKNNII